MRQVAIRGTIHDVAANRGINHRDCRQCKHFDDQGDELGYGWCRAHRQFVKLYQMTEGFWSQCQFKALTRDPRGNSPNEEPSNDVHLFHLEPSARRCDRT